MEKIISISDWLIRSSGNKEEAVASFTKAIELAPKNPDGYLQRGSSYLTQEKYDLAIADTTEVLPSWIRVMPWRTVIVALRISGSRIGKMRWRIMTLC